MNNNINQEQITEEIAEHREKLYADSINRINSLLRKLGVKCADDIILDSVKIEQEKSKIKQQIKDDILQNLSKK